MLNRMDKHEYGIVHESGSHTWTAESPERFHIMREGLRRGNFHSSRLKSPTMMRSVRDIKENVVKELEAYLSSFGINSIGYTHVPARWVFKDKAVMYSIAIVTSMEMDAKRIATAPSRAG